MSAADVILHEIKAFKAAKGVPVVVCLEGLATSELSWPGEGDAIIAYPTCITGSMGSLP